MYSYESLRIAPRAYEIHYARLKELTLGCESLLTATRAYIHRYESPNTATRSIARLREPIHGYNRLHSDIDTSRLSQLSKHSLRMSTRFSIPLVNQKKLQIFLPPTYQPSGLSKVNPFEYKPKKASEVPTFNKTECVSVSTDIVKVIASKPVDDSTNMVWGGKGYKLKDIEAWQCFTICNVRC